MKLMYSLNEDDFTPISFFKHDIKENNNSDTIIQMFKWAVSMDNRRWIENIAFFKPDVIENKQSETISPKVKRAVTL